jgi:iron complex outermembrane receptor protein
MKKYLLLVLTGLLNTYSVNAQNAIHGKVTDAEDGSPLFGAVIYISELKTGASTDTAGFFVIRNVPVGTFLAEVKMIGYAPQAVTVSAQGYNSPDAPAADIKMIKTPTEYHPVIITGVSGAAERKRDPVPMAVQTRDHILQHGATNAVSALAELPGISAVSTGNAIAKPVIRGLGYNRVVVLRNGIRQEGQQWGDEHGVELDEFEIDRVEIIKGPGSIMYGSDAMAGVINFLTPRTVEEGTITGEIIGSYQSNGLLVGHSLMTAGNLHGVSWQVRGSQKMAGNYSTPKDGNVANSGFKEFDASGFIGLNRSWGVSQICFSTFNQLVALPEGERDSLGHFVLPSLIGDSTATEQSFTSDELKGYHHSLEIPRQAIHHQRIVLSNSLFFGQSQLKIDIGYQRNDRNEFGNILDPQEKELSMQLSTSTLNSSFIFPEKNGSRIIAGMNLQRQSNQNSGSELIIPEYVAQDAGLFVHYRKIKGKWYFGAGLRGDVRALSSNAVYVDTSGNFSDNFTAGFSPKFDAINKTFSSWSAIAGGSYQISDATVFRVNISRGFRVPNISELSSNGKHEGTFRYEKGNPLLNSETSLQIDVGMTYTSDHFNFELSAFSNDIQNYIYLTKINSVFGGDSIVDSSDPAPVFTFVQGHARLYGGEIFTDFHPHPLDWLHFENSLSYVYGELFDQPDSMSCLPFMPPMKYQSEVNAHIEKKIGFFTHTYASAALSVYFAQNRIYSAYQTETTTPSYALLEAGAGTEIVNKKDKTVCRIFFSVNNILNTNYQSHLSRLKYAPVNPATGQQGIYGQGRNFSLRVIFPFSFKAQ